MVEAVPRQRRVVDLEVEPILVGQVVSLEEARDRRAVVVVLVLGRLLRLRLDEQRALEADPVLVLGDHRQETGELRLLAGHVGVEQRLVALAAAPQDVVAATEPMRRLEHRLDLGGREGEDGGVRVGGRARRVARMAEQVGRPPQQAEAGPRHPLLDHADDGVEVGLRLGVGVPFRRDVAVVEAEERHAELLEELERGVELGLGGEHRLESRIVPRAVEGPRTEHVRPGPGERMPQADGDAEVVLHPLAEDQPIGLVDLEGQRVGRVEPTEADPPRNIGKVPLGHRPNPPIVSSDGSPWRTRGSRPESTTPYLSKRSTNAHERPGGGRTRRSVLRREREREGDRIGREPAAAVGVEPVQPEVGHVDEVGRRRGSRGRPRPARRPGPTSSRGRPATRRSGPRSGRPSASRPGPRIGRWSGV